MNAATLSEVSVRCSFNTNIATLSITDFANYCQVEVEAAKEILAAIYDAKLVTSSAKSWKSPYFIRNVAVYLSNQAYLNAVAQDPATLEADLVVEAELAADLAEDESEDYDAEAAATQAEYEALLAAQHAKLEWDIETEEYETILVPAEDEPRQATQDDLSFQYEGEIPADVAVTKVHALDIVQELEGREPADQKAFRRMVRNQLAKNDLPWTIEKGTYFLQDPQYLYILKLEAGFVELYIREL